MGFLVGETGKAAAETLHFQDGKQQVMQVAAHIAAGTSTRVGGVYHWSVLKREFASFKVYIFEMGVIYSELYKLYKLYIYLSIYLSIYIYIIYIYT